MKPGQRENLDTVMANPSNGKLQRPREMGPAGIRQLGHRGYVGGDGEYWESIGRLQFRFLMGQGLKPEHVLLDVACGSLRAGVLLIPYLNEGNYLGIDMEAELITAGIDKELGRDLYQLKRPEFVISGDFEFDKFSISPDFSIAQSLFTHLTEEDIRKCLRNLRANVAAGAKFYATFFRSALEKVNSPKSHAHKMFEYTEQQMKTFGNDYDWRPNYIGEWDHPRGQVIMEYIANEP